MRVLASVADSLAMKAAARSMTIELPADLAGLPPVQGDQDELIQLFQNLIDNALKYGRAGSPVRVLARASEPPAAMTPARPAVAVAVIDQGEGIDRRASAAAHRALLPGGYRPLARSGRHRAGARHRQAYRQPSSRCLGDWKANWARAAASRSFCRNSSPATAVTAAYGR